MLENEQVNKIEPIWMLEKNKITDQMHTDFFRFLTGDEKNEYRFNLFYKTEMPISVRSIFYVPKTRGSMDLMNTDSKSEIALYCRKVLISNQTDLILPRWMRFFKVRNNIGAILKEFRALLIVKTFRSICRVNCSKILPWLPKFATLWPIDLSSFWMIGLESSQKSIFNFTKNTSSSSPRVLPAKRWPIAVMKCPNFYGKSEMEMVYKKLFVDTKVLPRVPVKWFPSPSTLRIWRKTSVTFSTCQLETVPKPRARRTWRLSSQKASKFCSCMTPMTRSCSAEWSVSKKRLYFQSKTILSMIAFLPRAWTSSWRYDIISHSPFIVFLGRRNWFEWFWQAQRLG